MMIFLWVPQEAAGVYQALQDVDGQVRNWLLAAELSLRILDSKQGVGQAGSTITTNRYMGKSTLKIDR